MSVSGEVAIIGMGKTKFGENFDLSYMDMVADASYQAFEDAGIEPKDVQAAWLGTAYAYDYTTEGNSGSSLGEAISLYDIPITRVANYCASGMDALRNACLGVASGEYDVALAVGVEKMRDVQPRGSLVAIHVEKGHPLYAKGRTAPGMFALMANRYFEVYGNAREAMSQVAVKNHYNGSMNPKAHFRKAITAEQASSAPLVADPLRLFDCTPTTDGAAAVVITRASLARKFTDQYVVVRGVGLAVTSGYFSAQFQQDWDFLGFRATREAAKSAYKQAGITNPRDQIDVAEVHDCFTITEILNYEDLGFCGRGEGKDFILSGTSKLDGELPVNTSGGLKASGHPIGASGIRMVVDVSEQILGRCGERQLKKVDVGLGHTLGGPGAVSCVFIVSKPD